jgi:hypothetical protein
MSSLQAEEDLLRTHEDKCTAYFTEIIEIQKFREMLTIGAEELIERYERGLLEKKKLDATLRVWYITESELGEKVTKIYDLVYAEKCFENIGTKEKR